MTAECRGLLVILGFVTTFNVFLMLGMTRLYAQCARKRHELDSGLFELANLRKIQAGRIDQ